MEIDGDLRKVEKKIRERIDHSKCLGRDLEVAWHKAPWVRGYILLENGRILPIEIMLSGIVVGDLLFSERAEPTGAANADADRLALHQVGLRCYRRRGAQHSARRRTAQPGSFLPLSDRCTPADLRPVFHCGSPVGDSSPPAAVQVTPTYNTRSHSGMSIARPPCSMIWVGTHEPGGARGLRIQGARTKFDIVIRCR